jgi:hypothetical protein
MLQVAALYPISNRKFQNTAAPHARSDILAAKPERV